MKIGLLGGSFDPIHNGHLYMAKMAIKEAHLDEVWLIPAGHSPNKCESNMTAAMHRLKMCEIVAKEEQSIQVCDIEFRSRETSYTYRTIEKLNAMYPEYQFSFIMGADSLSYFLEWKYPEKIAAGCELLVLNRDQFSLEELEEKCKEINQVFPANIKILQAPKMDVASRELRAMMEKKEDVSRFLSANVIYYIKEHGLYCS